MSSSPITDSVSVVQAAPQTQVIPPVVISPVAVTGQSVVQKELQALPNPPSWIWVLLPLVVTGGMALLGYFAVMGVSYNNDHAWVALGGIALFLSGLFTTSPLNLTRKA